MKILTGLNAVAVEGDWGEPRSFEHTVADEPVPGRARVVRLGTRGLTITNGAVSVAVPLSEVLKLAEAHEPGLKVQGDGSE